MKTRIQINNAINKKKLSIEKLKEEIKKLQIESFQLCDKSQSYTEEEEEWVACKKPKVTEKHIIGRIHWKEILKDMDTGDSITLDRCRMVRKDGIWLI